MFRNKYGPGYDRSYWESDNLECEWRCAQMVSAADLRWQNKAKGQEEMLTNLHKFVSGNSVNIIKSELGERDTKFASWWRLLLLLCLFGNQLLQKHHKGRLPGAAINIGTFVPILLEMIDRYQGERIPITSDTFGRIWFEYRNWYRFQFYSNAVVSLSSNVSQTWMFKEHAGFVELGFKGEKRAGNVPLQHENFANGKSPPFWSI